MSSITHFLVMCHIESWSVSQAIYYNQKADLCIAKSRRIAAVIKHNLGFVGANSRLPMKSSV